MGRQLCNFQWFYFHMRFSNIRLRLNVMHSMPLKQSCRGPCKSENYMISFHLAYCTCLKSILKKKVLIINLNVIESKIELNLIEADIIISFILRQILINLEGAYNLPTYHIHMYHILTLYFLWSFYQSYFGHNPFILHMP